MADPESVSYSKWVGFIFIFNLIVGTGALTLPGVFVKAGWLLSLLVIILLALISYMTVTFVIETMACANAVKNWQMNVLARNQEIRSSDEVTIENDSSSLLPVQSGSESDMERMPLNTQYSPLYYRLNRKCELGEMATLFFNDFGRVLFFLCICVYLYGDLSIYSAAVAKSLRDIVCKQTNITGEKFTHTSFLNMENDTNVACWDNHTLSRLNVYRLFLIGFTMIFGPFAAFNVQKTKYLQLMSAAFRWLAFTFMIAIAVKSLISNGVKGHPVAANFYGIPSLFGACVYSFMCHHSLPALITPIRNKLKIKKIIFYDYILICAFYVSLSLTGIFAFEHIKDLYTLNFIPTTLDDNIESMLLVVIDYFLALFPVFTLSSSYPIIAITLCNNLKCLFLDNAYIENYNLFIRRILFPFIAIFPPFVVTYFTESLASLVAFTGSYAGSAIQYAIPVSLVYCARQTCQQLLGNGVRNPFASPFQGNLWLLSVLLWAALCVSLVTIDFFV